MSLTKNELAMLIEMVNDRFFAVVEIIGELQTAEEKLAQTEYALELAALKDKLAEEAKLVLS